MSSDDIVEIPDELRKELNFDYIFVTKVESKTYAFSYEYRLLYKDELNNSNYLGHFTIAYFPGCCGLCILTGLLVELNRRSRGIGTWLQKLAIHIAKKNNSTIMVCTEVTGTEFRHIIGKHGWQDMFNFINRHTNNKVVFSMIDLRD